MREGFISSAGVVTINPATRRTTVFVIFEVAVIFYLIRLSHDTHSSALKSTAFFNVFVCFCLIVKIIGECVPHFTPNPKFSYGYDRLEVIVVFSSVILCILGSVFIVKEGIEAFFHVHHAVTSTGGGRLFVGACVGFFSQVFGILGARCRTLTHVFDSCNTSWFQEIFIGMGRRLVKFSPALGGRLRKVTRINPCYLVSFSNFCSIGFLESMVPTSQFRIVDLAVSLWTAVLISSTMLPFVVFTAKILMQFPPEHSSPALEVALLEILTAVDGVLECQDERFWQIGFPTSLGGRCVAGALRVRARRDANEAVIIRDVTLRLSHLVSNLTVHVFKDDWLYRPAIGNSLMIPFTEDVKSLPIPVGTQNWKQSGSILTRGINSDSALHTFVAIPDV
ncbi:unnamed protein product [Notodromas monacha]|uniref:Cation efflux protein transmembrane domain-containing protein n=1 Tax=Notodromas monacha TaxID=399045 RepID=A0A7R9BNJ0_9CRUS|nr:unnamed protein product [Notodromas monacha]CAG0918794.1 unnamed protein product [Notodromas monacha]